MSLSSSAKATDPYDLERFLKAQKDDYDRAISEIQAGRKRSHWMWYIFPQYAGLGFSSTAEYYAIKSLDEAKAYLAHTILGSRLIACAKAANAVEGKTALQIFGSPDDLKLRSCATLFAAISPPDSVFHKLIDKYYDGQMDSRTLALIGNV